MLLISRRTSHKILGSTGFPSHCRYMWAVCRETGIKGRWDCLLVWFSLSSKRSVRKAKGDFLHFFLIKFLPRKRKIISFMYFFSFFALFCFSLCFWYIFRKVINFQNVKGSVGQEGRKREKNRSPTGRGVAWRQGLLCGKKKW